jgi:hypothetical protein
MVFPRDDVCISTILQNVYAYVPLFRRRARLKRKVSLALAVVAWSKTKIVLGDAAAAVALGAFARGRVATFDLPRIPSACENIVRIKPHGVTEVQEVGDEPHDVARLDPPFHQSIGMREHDRAGLVHDLPHSLDRPVQLAHGVGAEEKARWNQPGRGTVDLGRNGRLGRIKNVGVLHVWKRYSLRCRFSLQ